MCVFMHPCCHDHVVFIENLLVKEALSDTQLTLALAEQGKLAELSLPDTTCCSLDEHDALFLDRCRLSAPSDVMKLVQAYPLRTVIKLIKLFLNIPDEHEVCTRMKFNDVNHLCPVRNSGLFDLVALVCSLCCSFLMRRYRCDGCQPGHADRPDDLSLLIVAVAPWDIKYDDLEEFAGAGVVSISYATYP